MGIWDQLSKAEKELRRRLENVFGRGTATTPLEVRREVLEQVKSRIAADIDGKTFPFEKVILRLKPATAVLHDIFKTAFFENDSLKADIQRTLADAQARYPDDLQIGVELIPAPEAGESHPTARDMFQLGFVRREPMREQEIPEVKLVITRGAAEQPEYKVKKGRILVGNLREVIDREGRMVRRNDLVFIDNGDDINSTVARVHARIWYDPEGREFYLIDEASRYGTRIVREGRSIEVPGGDLRGVSLKSGDEIYFGQASLRFELPPPQ
jgi:hypothetical protein